MYSNVEKWGFSPFYLHLAYVFGQKFIDITFRLFQQILKILRFYHPKKVKLKFLRPSSKQKVIFGILGCIFARKNLFHWKPFLTNVLKNIIKQLYVMPMNPFKLLKSLYPNVRL